MKQAVKDEPEPRAMRKNFSTYLARHEAVHAALLLGHMTGDRCAVVSIDKVYFQIVRIDPSGKEAEQ